jgi:hypothetical protein
MPSVHWLSYISFYETFKEKEEASRKKQSPPSYSSFFYRFLGILYEQSGGSF